MDTIVPSANAALLSSNDILKSMSAIIPEVIDNINLMSPPARALELSYLEQANPRGYTRPMFFIPAFEDVDEMAVVESFAKP